MCQGSSTIVLEKYMIMNKIHNEKVNPHIVPRNCKRFFIAGGMLAAKSALDEGFSD